MKEKLILNAKNNKKLTLFIIIVCGFFIFHIINKFDFNEVQTEKIYKERVAKTDEINKKLLRLKLDQKTQRLGIKPLHHQDVNIIDYTQTSYEVETQFMVDDGSGRVAKVPTRKPVVILHKSDGSKSYLFYNLLLKKIEE